MQYHHLFFHSLIVYPELAFRYENDSQHDFETWMITVDEYKALLNSLYERNYCLVKMSELLDEKQNVAAKFLRLGKIPLVFSYDDVNYYKYMDGYGFARKMVIDGAGNLANELITPDGKMIITRNADGPAILEEFIENHPDFSYHNARGILAVTGYEGILGYHDLESDRDELINVIEALKTKGWEFACHSYSHKKIIYNDESIDENQCIADTELWLSELTPYLSETAVYISPFGMKVQNHTRFLQYLKQVGFKYFCDVNNTRKYEIHDSCYFFSRINIDGFLFKKRNYEFEYYYGNLSSIISQQRLQEYPLYSADCDSLAMHAVVCSKLPTVYLWGGIGEYITKEVIERKKREYSRVFTNEKCRELNRLIGQGVRGYDCSGLIKQYLMGGLTHFKYDSSLDFNSSMLLEYAEHKGTIDTLPETSGICLYMPGHVGVYMGCGRVIESTSNPQFGCGVVNTQLKTREWTHWFCCPNIDYLQSIIFEENKHSNETKNDNFKNA